MKKEKKTFKKKNKKSNTKHMQNANCIAAHCHSNSNQPIEGSAVA